MTGIVWTGQVNFTDSSDVGVTGVATLTLTPNVGVTNLPALAAGDPGLPPVLRNVNVNQVAFGTAVPASSWVLVTAGDAATGVAPIYDLTLYVNSGQPGVSGAFALSSATDLVGTLTNKYTLVYSTTDNMWHVSPMLAGDIYAITPITGFTGYSGSSGTAVLGTLNIPAQPADWRPSVEGFATVVGTANTHVDLAAYLTSTTGDQVGWGPGQPGAAPPPIHIGRAFGAAIGPSLPYGKVLAGSAAQVLFVAKQSASTADAWSINAASCAFSVQVNPIP